jgi:hypothetical protein
MGLVFKMYDNESKGMKFPMLRWCRINTDLATDCVTPNDHVELGSALIPEMRSLYPEYLTDFNILMCPSDTEAGTQKAAWSCPANDPAAVISPLMVDNKSYNYYSWAIKPQYVLSDTANVNNTQYPLWRCSKRIFSSA